MLSRCSDEMASVRLVAGIVSIGAIVWASAATGSVFAGIALGFLTACVCFLWGAIAAGREHLTEIDLEDKPCKEDL